MWFLAFAIYCATRFAGRHTSNKLCPVKERLILAHINSIPRQNHYRRNHAPNREYISVNGIASLADMYRLYVRWMQERDSSELDNHPLEEVTVKECTYTHIARTRRNIGFSRYSDMCEVCSVFEKYGGKNTKAYVRHRLVEGECRRAHQIFAKNVPDDTCFLVCDKGSVKLLPKLNVDFAFYEPRLSLIPMTLHALPSDESVTFWWVETEGGRDTSHILSAINRHLKDLPQSIRHLRMHFDNCRGENKSQFNAYPFHPGHWNFIYFRAGYCEVLLCN